MSGLLKADLYRILKSKLTIVALILCVAFPFFIALLYFGLNQLFRIDGAEELLDTSIYTANSMLSGAYSLTNNIGLILPVFAGIYITMDISNGTIRNKVIVGKTRTEIYLSHLFTSMIFLVVSITVYVAFTLAFGLLFFKFVEFEDMTRNLVYFFVTGTMTFAFMATVVTFFALTTKNTALTIILSVAFPMLLAIIPTVFSFIDYEKYKALVYFIPTFSNANTTIAPASILDLLGSRGMNDQLFYEGIASCVFFGVLNTVLGCLIFNKKDMK